MPHSHCNSWHCHAADNAKVLREQPCALRLGGSLDLRFVRASDTIATTEPPQALCVTHPLPTSHELYSPLTLQLRVHQQSPPLRPGLSRAGGERWWQMRGHSSRQQPTQRSGGSRVAGAP